jgi:hypothetical protein
MDGGCSTRDHHTGVPGVTDHARPAASQFPSGEVGA